eukprot:Skav203135  [mRNA]  locus=scaffold5176:15747:23981:+ [translate_table: standard]
MRVCTTNFASSPQQAVQRADVDANGSDSEEEDVEESYPKNQQRGAVLLALVAFGLAADRCDAFSELQSCKGGDRRVFAFLFMVPAVEGSRSEAASLWLPSSFWNMAYWLVLGFFSFFFIAVNLWPFTPTCDVLMVMGEACEHRSLRLAKQKLDCTLQGHTACQMLQLWMLIMPYALPQFRSFHLTFIWLAWQLMGTRLSSPLGIRSRTNLGVEPVSGGKAFSLGGIGWVYSTKPFKWEEVPLSSLNYQVEDVTVGLGSQRGSSLPPLL